MSNRFAIVGRPTACPCRINQLRVKAGMIRPPMIEISIRISAKPIRIPSARSASAPIGHWGRSEEHTSELQSLMRISYAVFCLKKKKKHNTHNLKKRLKKTKQLPKNRQGSQNSPSEYTNRPETKYEL